MKLGIMQPYFLPYIGYFQLIKAVDKYIIYDDVNFIKGGWINRNNILVNGNKYRFNLLLNGASSNKLINEISVNLDQSKLLKTIAISYKKATYFETVFPIICHILAHRDRSLARFIGNSIIEICNYLNIETEIIYSSSFDKNNELKGSDKILNICKLQKSNCYINAIGGQTLYSRDDFKNEGIDLKFLQSNLSPYTQFTNEFVPCLSILDIIMFNSPKDTSKMLNNFVLL